MKTATNYVTNDGQEIPFKTWHDIGHGFSIMPLKTTCHIKHNASGRIERPVGPAGRDNLMMALYMSKFPSWAFHAFSPEETKDAPTNKAEIY